MKQMTRRLGALAAVALMACTAAPPPSATAEPQPDAEQWRPAVHYTPETNWMNDPNGLVYHNGQYHLFYQYNPEGSQWGNMSWGHATSTDLTHWTEQGVAIPHTEDYEVFSGSAVVDHANTSGLGTAESPPMVALWTRADRATGNQSQSLAYSTDDGSSWQVLNGGAPVLDIGSTEFRDPKVFWDEAVGHWTMVVSHPTEHRVSFYSSQNLIDWTETSSFGPAGDTSAIWECPDLFPLPVDGGAGGTKWVLVVTLGDSAQYFVGHWDGTAFTPDEAPGEASPQGEVLADFEQGYGGWTPQGTAFGTAPTTGDQPGHLGSGYADSFGTRDQDTGALTSPELTITQPYLNALIGGGDHPYDPAATGDDGGGRLLAGFNGSWEGWSVEGQALAAAPAAGATEGQQPIINQQGSGLLNSFTDASTGRGTDATTGTATSPAFTIEEDHLNLLMGGGDRPRGAPGGAAVVELIVDGQVVRSATGRNSEELNWQSWDVSELRGRQATIRAVDEATGDWGHLLLDEVRLSDRPATRIASHTALSVVVDGEVVASATGNSSERMTWASLDLRAYQGRRARIVIEDRNSTSVWGHVMVDQVMASSTRAADADAVGRLDYGRDYYAAMTWDGAPDGGRYQIGWMSNWKYAGALPTTTWRTAMSVPRRLSLRTMEGRPQLVAEPVESLESLRTGRALTLEDASIRPGTTGVDGARGTALDISLALDPGSARTSGLKVLDDGEHFTLIGYDATTGQVVVDRTDSGLTGFSPHFPSRSRAPVAPDESGLVRLRIVVDAHSVEVFAADGSRVLTSTVYPPPGATGVSLYAEGGSARVDSLSLWHLGSARGGSAPGQED